VAWLLLSRYWVDWESRRRAVKLLKEGKSSLENEEAAIGLEGGAIMVCDDDGESRLKYSAIDKIVSTDAHVFINLSNIAALPIARAKVSEGDLDSFVEELNRRMDAAKSQDIAK
jgi:hypothetical protein